MVNVEAEKLPVRIYSKNGVVDEAKSIFSSAAATALVPGLNSFITERNKLSTPLLPYYIVAINTQDLAEVNKCISHDALCSD